MTKKYPQEDDSKIGSLEKFKLNHPERDVFDYFIVYDPEVVGMYISILEKIEIGTRLRLTKNETKEIFCTQLREILDRIGNENFNINVNKYFGSLIKNIEQSGGLNKKEVSILLDKICDYFKERNIINIIRDKVLNIIKK